MVKNEFDIDVLKAQVFDAKDGYTFKKFMSSANILQGPYSVISELLEKCKEGNKDESYICDILGEGARLSYNNKKNKSKDYDFTDKEADQAISGFFETMKQKGEKKEDILKHLELLYLIIENEGHDPNVVDNIFKIDIVQDAIADHFLGLVTEDFKKAIEERIALEQKDKKNSVFFIANKKISYLLYENPQAIRYHYWWNMYTFLEIQRLLRNAEAHVKRELTDGNNGRAIACFMLYTYIGTFLALSKNLELCEAYKPVPRCLRVFFKPGVSKEFKEGNGKEVIKESFPKIRLFEVIEDGTEKEIFRNEEASGDVYLGFELEPGKSYKIECGSVNTHIPDDIVNKPVKSPVAIWNDFKFSFALDLSRVHGKFNPYVDNAILELLEKGNKQREELLGHARNTEDSNERLVELTETLVESEKKRTSKEAEKEERRKAEETKRKTIWSIGVGLVLIALLVGVGIWVYSQDNKQEDVKILKPVKPYSQEYDVLLPGHLGYGLPRELDDFFFRESSYIQPDHMIFQYDSLGLLHGVSNTQKNNRYTFQYQYKMSECVLSNGIKDSITVSDMDEYDPYRLPMSGHLELGQTLESLTYTSLFRWKEDKKDEIDIEYIKMTLDSSTANFFYDNKANNIIPPRWDGNKRSIMIKFRYGNNAHVAISDSLRSVLFCPYLFNMLLPGGFGYYASARIGQLAHHIPDRCEIEIERADSERYYFSLEFDPQSDDNGKPTGMAFGLRYHGANLVNQPPTQPLPIVYSIPQKRLIQRSPKP